MTENKETKTKKEDIIKEELTKEKELSMSEQIEQEKDFQEFIKSEAKEKKVLVPTNDVIFKRLFGVKGCEELVKDLLEAILKIKIKSLELR